MKPNDRVQWIYTSRDNEELARRYDSWANTYDKDLDEACGWIGPQRAVELFARWVPRHARVLDAGAGTGLVGQVLADCGYADIVAGDLSTGMLEKARQKSVYRGFHLMVLGEPLDFESNAFDAIISVGVLTRGHAPPSAFDELLRITKPGGHIVFALRTDVYAQDGFKGKQTELERMNAWVPAAVGDPFQPMPRGEPDVWHRVWVYRVIADS
jgi:SAM-dependent methyltransferase